MTSLQIQLRRTTKLLNIPGLMAHSTSGRGWVRSGLTKENPIHANDPVLFLAYEDSRSVYSVLYEWAIRRGFIVLPERVEKPERADIELDIIMQVFDEHQGEKLENTMLKLVPEDKDNQFYMKRKKLKE